MVFPLQKIIITTSGYPKELTHYRNRILTAVALDYSVFNEWLHILSVNCIKSRSSSFSIFNRLFSYLYSCKVRAGLRPRTWGIPASSFFRSQFSRFFIAFFPVRPSSFATSSCVIPVASFSWMIGRRCWILLYVLLDIAKPPYVVLLSYIKGLFVIVRFYWTCSAGCAPTTAKFYTEQKDIWNRKKCRDTNWRGICTR